jgi:hypothetical protein
MMTFDDLWKATLSLLGLIGVGALLVLVPNIIMLVLLVAWIAVMLRLVWQGVKLYFGRE